MKDLLGFRLNNPMAFSHKAFGSEQLVIPRPKKEEVLRISLKKVKQMNTQRFETGKNPNPSARKSRIFAETAKLQSMAATHRSKQGGTARNSSPGIGENNNAVT